MSRRKLRAIALQVLYEVDGVGHDPGFALSRRLEEQQLDPESVGFVRTLVEGVLKDMTQLDETIARFAPAWPVSQLALIDRNILRMSLLELREGSDTPPKVAVNEAVELAKLFGSDSSARFVNGVLGSVIESLEETAQLST